MLRILFVPLEDASLTRAAWEWLATQPGITSLRTQPADLARNLSLVKPDVIWIDAAAPAAALPPQLTGFPVTAGVEAPAPGLLLTRGAAVLPSLLGLEPAMPSELVDRPWRNAEDDLFFFDDFAETPRLRGHAAFRMHRLFRGLGGGAFTWRPTEGQRDARVTWRQPDWPRAARVLAVERAFIHINASRATIWEYDAPQRTLCIGAYLPFESADELLRPALERFARNALLYGAGRTPAVDGAPDLWWPRPDPRAIRDASILRTGESSADAANGMTSQPSERDEPLPLEIAPIRYASGPPTNDPFTIAGRRAFAAGHENSGVTELWVHPLRALRIERSAGTTTGRIEISPLGMTRPLRAASTPETGGALDHEDAARARAVAPPSSSAVALERVAILRDLPAAVFEWEASAGTDRWKLEWTIVLDLRLMWPFPASVLAPLHWNASADTLACRSAVTGEEVRLIASRPVAWVVHDSSGDDAARLRCTLHASLEPASRLRVMVVAQVLGDRPVEALCATARDAVSHVRASAAALSRARQQGLRVAAPDPRVGTAVECAAARLDSYRVETPLLGRSLIAGYWTSRPGWNEGRPGYAWYFGRDAAWTSFGCLAAGDFEAAREAIAFLGRHQDASGKILHECTTSGSVHYDAADSTPLWLLLVARRHAWSGDASFTRSQWQRVTRAIRFCLATDRDRDGLIENTGVGHGWIEFGRLGGGDVTYYNAGIWAAALLELAHAARDIGEPDFARELEERARTARSALETLFWDAQASAYALKAARANDGWARDTTLTATHAVPLLLGVADADRAGRWLDAVAGPDFTAEWGVRMIACTDPGFDATSYHGGAVWPLYTGWTSWAEFAAGRSQAAARHWLMNVQRAFEGARGSWEEVLHGTERSSIGVCPDQAWSTAMVIAPLVCGLLGAEPDATRGRLRLRPQVPAEWDHLDIRGLRVADAQVDVGYRRSGRMHAFSVEQVAGAIPLRLVLEPALPATRITAVRVDGVPATLDARSFGERMLVPLQVALDHARTIEIEAD